MQTTQMMEEKSMKKLFVFMVTVVFLFCFSTDAFTAPKIVQESLVTETAIVQTIDLKNRVVTLKDKDGHVADIKVGEKVKNLPQVKVGDQVEVTYTQALAIAVSQLKQTLKISCRNCQEMNQITISR